jgi:hypothetical protein
MKAGAAMMSAPNGTLLSGLGVGLNSGVDAYSQAQAQQRAIQDKLVQAQMAQGNSLAGAMEKSAGLGQQMSQMQGQDYRQAQNMAQQAAMSAAGIPQQNFQSQQSSDQFDAQQQVRMLEAQAAMMHANAAKDQSSGALQANIDKNIADTYQKTFNDTYSSWFKNKGIDMESASPNEKAAAQQAALANANSAAQFAAMVHTTHGANLMRYDSSGKLISGSK